MLRQLAAAVLPLLAFAAATGAGAERVVVLRAGSEASDRFGAVAAGTFAHGAPEADATDAPFGSPRASGRFAYLADAVPTRRIMASARAASRGGDLRYSVDEASFLGVRFGRLPEPATWAMMLGGFVLAALAIRRGIRASEARFDARLRRIAAGED